MAHQEPVPSREVAYTAVFEPAEEGGYVVTFPAIPNLATQGKTLDEARDERERADAIRSQIRVSLQIA